MGPQGGMGVRAQVLNACAGLGIVDPSRFYALPTDIQRDWIEHFNAVFSGAYMKAPRRRQQSPAEADSVEREARRAARKRAG